MCVRTYEWRDGMEKRSVAHKWRQRQNYTRPLDGKEQNAHESSAAFAAGVQNPRSAKMKNKSANNPEINVYKKEYIKQ